jgi:hypothetical protein
MCRLQRGFREAWCPDLNYSLTWLEPGPLPADLLVPYPAEEMQAWRVSDDAKSSRIEPHPGMAEPVAE